MLKKALRRKEWWSYKLPPLFGFAYLGLTMNGIPLVDSWGALAFALVWMLGAAGFGYYCNDVFDIEQDRIVGKANSAAGHSPIIRLVVLVCLACMAVLPWAVMGRGVVLTVLSVAHLGLFLLYSVPPVRLKDCSWAGATADTLYAHVLPSVMVLLAFGPQDSLQWSGLIVATGLWQGVLGLRSILAHQVADMGSDMINGTGTFAIHLGSARAETLLAVTLPTLEAITIFIFLLSILPLSMGIAFGAIITVGLVMVSRPFGEGVLRYHRYRSEVVSAMFNQIQEAYLPLVFLVALCAVDSLYVPVALIHVLLFFPGNAHVVKPLYYRGVIGLLYIGLVKRSYYHGAQPFYHGIRSALTHLCFAVFHGLRVIVLRMWHALIIWPAYNILLRSAVELWHLAFRIRKGHWHHSYRSNVSR